jgi:hypothetical protein
MKARGWITTTVLLTASVLTAGILVHRSARSADHLDSPAVVADSTIDINDVYTWMDGTNFVAAVTIYPNAPNAGDGGAGALFSNAAQYVIHTSSGAAYGATNTIYDIICTFAGTTAPQTVSCWAGTNDYVTGNANTTAGITSASTKFKVFAGLRADPFHFNLAGFKHTVQTVEAAAGGLTFNDAGCPNLDSTTAGVLRGMLATQPDGGPAVDAFQTFNALAIVVSLDKSLVTGGGPIVSVWAATHK